MNTRSKCSDHSLDLRIAVNSLKAGLLHIEDLASQRKNSLCRSGSCGLGRTAGGITLNYENLTILRILICAVCQLAREGHSVQSRFSSGQIAGFSRRLAGSLGENRFLYRCLTNLRVLLKENLQLFGYDLIYRPSCLRISELLLCLTLELGILDLDTDYSCHTFPDIFAGKIRLAVLEKFIISRIIIECLGDCSPEALYMHAAFRSNDVVDESVGIFLKSVVVLHGNFNVYVIPGALTVNDLVIEGRGRPVQILNELDNSALVVERLLPLFLFPEVRERNSESLGEECHLAESVLQRIKIIVGIFKYLTVREESDAGSVFLRVTVTDNFQVVHSIAALISLLIDFAFAEYLNLQPL